MAALLPRLISSPDTATISPLPLIVAALPAANCRSLPLPTNVTISPVPPVTSLLLPLIVPEALAVNCTEELDALICAPLPLSVNEVAVPLSVLFVPVSTMEPWFTSTVVFVPETLTLSSEPLSVSPLSSPPPPPLSSSITALLTCSVLFVPDSAILSPVPPVMLLPDPATLAVLLLPRLILVPVPLASMFVLLPAEIVVAFDTVHWAPSSTTTVPFVAIVMMLPTVCDASSTEALF